MSEERLSRIEGRLDELRDLISAEIGEVHRRLDDHLQGEVQRWWQSSLARWGFGLVAFWGTGALLAWGMLPTYFFNSLIDVAGTTLKEMPK